MLSILQICNRFPFPPKDGGAIAMYNTTKAFYNLGCKTDLLVINTKKHFVNVKELPDNFKKLVNRIEWLDADTNVKAIEAFFNLFSSESYNINRFNLSGFDAKLKQLLSNQQYDLIHIEGLYVSMYLKTIRLYSNAVVALRAHNVEHLIWERLAAAETNFIKKNYLKLLARRLKKYEKSILNEFDAIIPITEVDELAFKKLGCTRPMKVTPVGIDLRKLPAYKEDNASNLFFLGSLDWMPNLEGLKWFLANCWSKINERHPDLKLFIAGRNMPAEIKNLSINNVQIVGEVENAYQFMNTHSIMLVPLFSGSGMRVKIIEGLAMGKLVISTSIGAEGIHYENNKHLLIADNADQFVQSISFAIENAYVCARIKKNATELVSKKYANDELIKALIHFYLGLISEKEN